MTYAVTNQSDNSLAINFSKTLIFLLLFSMTFCAVFAQKSTRISLSKVKSYSIEQFMKTTRLGGNAFSVDEKSILFHSNKTGVYNVYTVSIAGGKQQPLTNSTEESIYAISYFPNDSRFIYT